MYEKLVKMLRVCGNSNNSCGNCPICENDGSCPHGEWEFAAEKFMLKAADAIEELSMRLHGDEAAIAGMKREIEWMVVAEKPRWIPVTERLPDVFKHVLVNIPGMAPYPTVQEAFREKNGLWYSSGFRYEADEITHWMSLPEPPKEG